MVGKSKAGMNATASRSPRKIWGQRFLVLLLIFMVPFLTYCGFYVYVMIMHGHLGSAKVIATDTSCGNGDNRIVVYEYDNGDGYLELTNRDGKVFAASSYTRGVDYTPFRWDKSCKKVLVGSNDGLIFLTAK